MIKQRYYDSNIGRFVSADRLYEEEMDQRGVSSQELNLFAYVKNDPLNSVDPSGEAGVGAGGGFSFTLGIIRFAFSVDIRAIHDSTKSVFDLSSYSGGVHPTYSYNANGEKVTMNGENLNSVVGGLHADAGMSFKVTNADNISQIKGKSLNFGASAGWGFGGSLESSLMVDDRGNILTNESGTPIVETGISVEGTVGAELHIATEATTGDALGGESFSLEFGAY